ncbi:hypothetical protein MRX96_009940 [Rhipicephalus microplus]
MHTAQGLVLVQFHGGSQIHLMVLAHEDTHTGTCVLRPQAPTCSAAAALVAVSWRCEYRLGSVNPIRGDSGTPRTRLSSAEIASSFRPVLRESNK